MKTVFVLVAILSVVLAQETYDANRNYNFEYAVSDPVTGDQKSQSETRNGDTVQGYYQLLEPDGTYRTVTYVADPIGGFRASVSKAGAPGAPVAKIAPVIKPQPVVSVLPKAVPLPVVAPKAVVPPPAPATLVPSASVSYPYYSPYPYSAYPYSSYSYPYYNGYYPYYSSGYYPYYNYKK